jgi:hypothetical protein
MKRFLSVLCVCLAFTSISKAAVYSGDSVAIKFSLIYSGLAGQAREHLSLKPMDDGTLGIQILLTDTSWVPPHSPRTVATSGISIVRGLSVHTDGDSLIADFGKRQVLLATHKFLSGWELEDGVSLEAVKTYQSPHSWIVRPSIEIN